MNSKSNIKVLTNDNIDRSEWSKFLEIAEAANPFQSLSFYDFFKSEAGQDAVAVAIKDANGIEAMAVAAIHKESGIKSYFSKRAIVYGGLPFKNSKYIPLVLEALEKELAGKAIYIEIRNFFNYKEQHSHFEGWEYLPHMNVQLDTSNFKDIDGYLSSLKYNRRREIKQSIKEGGEYFETNKVEEISEVYRILEDLYNERVKLPIPSLQFFLNQKDFDCFKVFAVKRENTIIGGAFTLYMEKQGIYTWYYCGIRDYHKKVFPTHLAVLGVIDFAIQNQIPRVDFMGAGKPEEEYGVRQYKLQFGGELLEDGRYMKVINPMMFSIGKTGLKVLSKIKK